MNPFTLLCVPSCLAVATLLVSPAAAQSTTRVSVDSAGAQGDSQSSIPSISANGRYIAFESFASNLVPGDTNGTWDIFVHDRQTGQTTRVSVDSLGVGGNGMSRLPRISYDGRYVAFASVATSLVVGDTNSRDDVFVHDRLTGQTTRVSVDSFGVQGNGGSWSSSISSDGRHVAFESGATNLVPGDTNGTWDVFVHDRQTGLTSRVSVDSVGVQGNHLSFTPTISDDGRTVAFYGYATNLVPGDTNGTADVFVHDRQTGQTSRVSVDSLGVQGNGLSWYPSISADGRYVAFDSFATNLVPGDTNSWDDVFVHDRQTGQTTRVSVDSLGVQGNSASAIPSISTDGRYVAFESGATNLVSSDTNGYRDVFVHDRQTGQTSLLSVDSARVQGNNSSNSSSISADGRIVTFVSVATNLVPGDTNGWDDVFVHDRGAIGPDLSITGTCPGAITLTVAGATANGSVVIIYGPAGIFVKPTPPCQGLMLGVSPPTLGALRTADGSGTAVLNFTAPPGACGRSVQAVDVTTCTATNLIVL